MTSLVKISYEGENVTVSARELHEFLEVETEFSHWFKRMCEYGFEEGESYSSFLTDRSDGLPGRPKQDAALSLDMAKEICMLQRTERGKQARQYFIQIEKDWNTPEKVMARALQIAERQIAKLKAENVALSIDMNEAKPKAEYFDALVERGDLTNIRDTAKLLHVPEKVFTACLVDWGYLYRDLRGHLKPYSTEDKLFQVKESMNKTTGWAGAQTLVTPDGKALFAKMDYSPAIRARELTKKGGMKRCRMVHEKAV